tara:strand:- start:1244 stop:2197 length:954 start_codon:yes stop_codon:yes gene_type:complete
MSYLKTKKGSLEDAIRKHDEDYQAMFKKELEKTGKSIPQMTPDEKKKFFNKIDKMHTAKNEVKEEQISEMKKVEIKLHPQNIDNTIQKIQKHIDIINRGRGTKIDVIQNMSDDSVTLDGRGADVGREVRDIRNFIGFKSAKVIESVEEGKMSQIASYIDDIANAMSKDSMTKPFITKFKADARKTLDPGKSLEKILPDYVPGQKIAKLLNMSEAKGKVDVLKTKLAKEKDTDALEKQITQLTGQLALARQQLENEKNKAIKPEPNPETGEVPLTVGVAYKHLRDKMKKDEEKKNGKKTMVGTKANKVDTEPEVEFDK